MQVKDGSGLQLTRRAYEFINESLRNAERAAHEGSHLWTFAISNIAQGIELLLKERLRREHPVLVFVDVERNRTNTVSFSQALARLERCGINLAGKDVERIQRARELRNSLVHFVAEVTEEQLRAAYVDFFEFAHAFHHDELGAELHPEIDNDLWRAEAALMEAFHREFVPYQGSTVSKTWPSEIVQAQFRPALIIDGVEYRRHRYGEEQGWSSNMQLTTCHDCSVLPKQFHGDGCDMEQCPKCGQQLITCACDAEYGDE